MSIDTIIILLAVVLLTAIQFIAVSRNRQNASDSGKRSDEATLRQMEMMQTMHEKQLADLRHQYEQQQQTMRLQYEQQAEALKQLQTRQAEQINALQEKQSEDLRRESAAYFKSLARDILDSNASSLKETNRENIEAILKPLRENIESFRKVVNDSYVQENASRQSLSDQITRLMELNRSIGNDARNLTSALKGNSKVQGDWGEMVLETLLEESGLTKGVHFHTQVTRDSNGETLRDDEGRLKRPDVVINLPDKHKMIVDSKVSLTAYTEYCSADDEAARNRAGQMHLLSVRRHIDELAGKNYQKDLKGSADHVLMFIPNEGAYITAIQLDTTLWKYAYEKHVAIVSPTHLFSVMRIISQLWIQDAQNRNVIAIAKRGGALYDKIVKFTTDFLKAEKALENASAAFGDAYKVLVTGRGNIISQAENLKKLGASTAKTLPSKLLDDAEMTELPDSTSTDAEP